MFPVRKFRLMSTMEWENFSSSLARRVEAALFHVHHEYIRSTNRRVDVKSAPLCGVPMKIMAEVESRTVEYRSGSCIASSNALFTTSPPRLCATKMMGRFCDS